jgi:nitrogen regulatory protein PII
MTTLKTEKRALLCIITEAVLEQTLLAELERLSVKGCTVTDARGRGSQGVRNAAWDSVANVRIEVICARPLAEQVLQFLQDRYFDDFAMIAFIQEVDVLRSGKF